MGIPAILKQLVKYDGRLGSCEGVDVYIDRLDVERVKLLRFQLRHIRVRNLYCALQDVRDFVELKSLL